MAEVTGILLPGEALAAIRRKKATTVMAIAPTVLPTMAIVMAAGIMVMGISTAVCVGEMVAAED